MWVQVYITSFKLYSNKDNLKARLAYSTISQLSYAVLGGALATYCSRSSLTYYNACCWQQFVLAAGAIYVATHISKISDLNGLGKSMPLTFAAFFIGSFYYRRPTYGDLE